jgi:hypothetical protein
MSGLPWYRCDPAKFNDGMIGLTRSERGVYVTVINAIYIEGGPVRDDPVYWGHVFGCPQSAWLKDRASLVAKGKLYECPTAHGEPGLMNRKARSELDNQFAFKSAAAEFGRKGGSKSRRKPRKDKGIKRPIGNPKGTLSLPLGYPKQIEREIHPLPIQEGAIAESGDVGSSANVVPLAGRGSA